MSRVRVRGDERIDRLIVWLKEISSVAALILITSTVFPR